LAAALISAGRSADLLSHPQYASLFAGISASASPSAAPSATPVASMEVAFELVFNAASALAEVGSPSLALHALALAQAKGERTLLDEGLSAAQVFDDLAAVRAQAAYVLQRAHFDQAAAALYDQVLAAHPADSAVPAVVTNNLAQLRPGGKGLVDSFRHLAAVLRGNGPGHTSAAANKLTKRQILCLHYNNALVHFYLRRTDEAKAALGKFQAALAALDPATAQTADLRAFALKADVLAAAVATAEEQAAAVAAAVPTAAAVVATALGSLLAKLQALPATAPTGVGATAPSPAALVRAQLLVTDGRRYAEAASVLREQMGPHSSAPPHPALALVVAHLQLAAASPDAALATLRAAADRWAPRAADSAEARAALAECCHGAAALLLATKADHNGARTAIDGLVKALPAAASLEKAAALATLALLQSQSAAAAAAAMDEAAAAAAARDIDALVQAAKAASAAVLPSHAQAHSGAEAARAPASGAEQEARIDLLESLSASALAASPASAAADAGTRRSATAGGSLAAAAPDVTTLAGSEAAAAKAAAKNRKSCLARRAKNKAKVLEKLKATGKFDVLGLPAPDPERWVPKEDRTYGKKTRRRNLAAKGPQVSNAAQGASAGSEALAQSLDAKAKVDAAKAKAATAPAPAPAPSKKKGRR
jgi:hypothetical protein